MSEFGTERIAADFDRAFTAIERLMETQGRALAAIFDQVAEHGDELLALHGRVDAIRDYMATRADLDDLRLEVREATATPFDVRSDDAA